MKKILINGNFLCRNLTGIERYAFEVLKCLDNMISENPSDEKEFLKTEFSLLLPKNAKTVPEYKNIKLVASEKEIHRFPKWDLGEFKKQCKKQNATGLNFSNTAPLGKLCGYAFLHDIYAADFPKDFCGLKDTLIKIYDILNYKNIAKNAKLIFTVSNFSKMQIIKKYKVAPEKIIVAPNGWDHFKSIEEDASIFKKFPALAENKFYFMLGSLSKRKNLLWIKNYAEKHSDEIFAVSGKAISGLVPDELKSLKTMKNVVLLGYVSDGEVKSLMKKCEAFVFPSYYEGFGIPPLEALSVGAKIVVAKDASLPEIYRNSAYYIDSKNSDVDLGEILKSTVASADSILDEYTYENSARILYEALK